MRYCIKNVTSVKLIVSIGPSSLIRLCAFFFFCTQNSWQPSIIIRLTAAWPDNRTETFMPLLVIIYTFISRRAARATAFVYIYTYVCVRVFLLILIINNVFPSLDGGELADFRADAVKRSFPIPLVGAKLYPKPLEFRRFPRNGEQNKSPKKP